MNRQSRALLTILVVAAVILPIWLWSRANPGSNVPGPDGRRVLPTRGGSAVASTRTDVRSFNRLMQPGIPTEIFSMLTYGKLVRVNRATQELEPWLAERWTVDPEGRVFTVSLREGLRWSDGVPFTSADVVFTVAAVYDPATNSPTASSLQVAGKPLTVTARDPRTVVVTFPAFFAPGLRLLDNLPILPSHRLASALAEGRFAEAWGPATPPPELVGMGPFVLTLHQPGQRLVFERNPHYWRRDAAGTQLPYLDRLTLDIVPTQDTEVLRLQSGETDFTQDMLRAEDLATLQLATEQGRVHMDEVGVSPDPDVFVFNLRSERWKQDPRSAWLTRKEFRQALSHAVDREALADTVFLGAAVPIHGPVTSGNTNWHWPSLPRYGFSRDKARALLASIGLTNRDADEWLEDERGTEARFTALAIGSSTPINRTLSVLRDDWRQIGVELQTVSLELNTVRSRVMAGDFETAMISYYSTDSDPAINKDLWLSSGSAHFWNPEQTTPATDWERRVDELMTQQTATADMNERKRLFNEVQRLFAENLPMLHFAAPRVHVARSARLLSGPPSVSRPPLIWNADTLALTATTTATARTP